MLFNQTRMSLLLIQMSHEPSPIFRTKKRKRVIHSSGMVFRHGNRKPPLSKDVMKKRLKASGVICDGRELMVDIAHKWVLLRATITIQRHYRERIRHLLCIKRCLRRLPNNTMCPITLEKLKSDRLFKLVRGKTLYGYDCCALGKYVLTSLDLEDPVCRVAMNSIEINRLDKKNMEVGRNLKLMELLQNIEKGRRKVNERVNLFMGIESVAEGIYYQIRDYLMDVGLECDHAPWPSHTMEERVDESVRDLMDFFNDLRENMDIMCAIDPGRCLMDVNMWRLALWEMRQDFPPGVRIILAATLRLFSDYEQVVTRYIQGMSNLL